MAAEEPPKLIEQLKLLREEWGEGFDEDIAQPLARFVLTMREQYTAFVRHQEAEVEERDGKIDHLEGELSHLEEDQISREEVVEGLDDLSHGIRTLDELRERWRPVRVT